MQLTTPFRLLSLSSWVRFLAFGQYRGDQYPPDHYAKVCMPVLGRSWASDQGIEGSGSEAKREGWVKWADTVGGWSGGVGRPDLVPSRTRSSLSVECAPTHAYAHACSICDDAAAGCHGRCTRSTLHVSLLAVCRTAYYLHDPAQTRKHARPPSHAHTLTRAHHTHTHTHTHTLHERDV
jgi:hypothetical protein